MFKIIMLLFISLCIVGCGDDSSSSQNYNYAGSVSTDEVILISGGSIMRDDPVPDNASLYTISSNIPPTPSYGAPLINYSLKGDLSAYDKYKSNTSSVQDYFNTYMSKVASTNDEDIDMRNILKRQLDFNRIANENNFKPIIEKNKEDRINYKTVPDNIEIGTQWRNIYVMSNPSINAQTVTNATCVDISDHVYYFVDNSLLDTVNIALIKEIKSDFEKGYLLVHEKCGPENDIDNNGKIIFLFTPINGSLLGFFYTADKYLNKDTIQGGTYSNESEILYINSIFLHDDATFYRNKRLLVATLIHEFHHMALFDVRSRLGYSAFMDYYINEGLSTLTSYYAGYPDIMYNYVYNFFTSETNVSLVNNTQNLSYGYSYLFMRYFYNRFKDEGLKKLITSPFIDYRAFESGSGMAFNDLYKDFLKMLLVTGRNVTDDTRYNVEEFNYKSNTAEYMKSYISIPDLFDRLTLVQSSSNNFLTDNGYTSNNVQPYTFQYKKWKYKPAYMELQGTNISTFYSLF